MQELGLTTIFDYEKIAFENINFFALLSQ